MTVFIITLLLPLFALGVALSQISKDMLIPKAEFHGKNRWQILNNKGKWYVFISFIILLAVEVTLIIKGPDKANKSLITTMPTIVYVPKTETKILVEKAVKNVPQFAFLRFSDLNIDNPISTTGKTDSVVINYSIKNIGTANAFNVKVNDFFICIVKSKFITQKALHPVKINKSFIIYPGLNEGLKAYCPVLVSGPVMDSEYYCYKLDFTDISKKPKSFMKIFRIGYKQMKFFEPNDSTYNAIEKYLIRNKYISSPFKQ